LDTNTPTAYPLSGARPQVPSSPSTFTERIGPALGPVPSDGGDERLNRPRPRLLVVDDEPEVLRSLFDLLRIDYRVITCATVARALEVLRSTEDAHVIMSDQRMPEMTGVEVLRQAKAIRPETTRLLFTAHADIRTVRTDSASLILFRQRIA